MNRQERAADRALNKRFQELFTKEQEDRMEFAVNIETAEAIVWRFTLDKKPIRMKYDFTTKKITVN
ncbi:hypothetical protein ACP26L_35915 (plasmid) [Paenibacillus sp. S-38]|uniref:hypothetical protein n=1 Tax=Paenibacillus sp. S-38 TaxID=3416710 RepID=UPI003CF5CE60